ncbi:dTDP-4-amino-4,6-dideoxy-D-glucose transaminase [Marinomonas gallaica]|uniref:dTDP-4-amino-4,6-dideoxy-D-glucose transaminase n=1 Tax=Marinomonas gallaica TaxID=1806667 RepID=A0A1C3JV02_9GAMM|nr:DegT/DnrJ/EryC1/StrS family aminotransferase [Marinomonas gallaica]SBT18952.1 dTDP-4-amino-4,6-dideoxy-D-glucose transaminase [Marinomonas gallaica]SBT21907.1 dTDP-4-amino-4,6-dideoxy-D-glucose transaminase [Marinomonas gallaica]
MINVTEPHLPDKVKYQAYVDRIYKAKRLTNNGPLVEELRQRLEKHLKVKNLLLVTNGTIAIQIALKLLGSKKVLTTPFSFVATASAPSWEGCDVEFSDINLSTFNIDPVEILKKVKANSEIDCVLPVHVFGNPCEISEIEKIQEIYGFNIIYDAAHAFDVIYREQSVLSYGDISTISFHATKLFHSVEGGALIIKDDELFKKAKALINFGYDGGEIISIGINAKMSEFHAAMGLCVLDDIDFIKSKREELFFEYKKKLSSKLSYQDFCIDGSNNFSYFPVVFSDPCILLKVIKALNEENIFPRRYFYPSLSDICYLNYGDFKNSEFLSERILCLPIYPSLELDQQNKIIKIVNDCLI